MNEYTRGQGEKNKTKKLFYKYFLKVFHNENNEDLDIDFHRFFQIYT